MKIICKYISYNDDYLCVAVVVVHTCYTQEREGNYEVGPHIEAVDEWIGSSPDFLWKYLT